MKNRRIKGKRKRNHSGEKGKLVFQRLKMFSSPGISHSFYFLDEKITSTQEKAYQMLFPSRECIRSSLSFAVFVALFTAIFFGKVFSTFFHYQSRRGVLFFCFLLKCLFLLLSKSCSCCSNVFSRGSLYQTQWNREQKKNCQKEIMKIFLFLIERNICWSFFFSENSLLTTLFALHIKNAWWFQNQSYHSFMVISPEYNG